MRAEQIFVLYCSAVRLLSLGIILLSFVWICFCFFFYGVDARHQESCAQRMVAISPALNPDGMSASAISALLYLHEFSIFLPPGAGKGMTWFSKNSRKMLKTQPEPPCHLLWAAPRTGPHLVWSLHLGYVSVAQGAGLIRCRGCSWICLCHCSCTLWQVSCSWMNAPGPLLENVMAWLSVW